MDPRADPQLARRERQVGRVDRVLEERLDAGHEDARPPALPRGEGGDPGGRLVGDQLAAFVGQRGPRLQDGDGLRVAEPGAEFLRDAIGDLRVAGDPDEALAIGRLGEGRGEVGLGAVRDRDEADVAPGPAGIVLGTSPGARGGRRTCRSRRGAAAGRRDPGGDARPCAPDRPVAPAVVLGRASRPRLRRRAPGVLDLGVDRRDVEVDLLVGGCRRVACREVGRDSFGDPAVAAAAATERRVGHRSGVRLGQADPTPARARPSDPVGVGRAVDLARGGEPGRVGGTQLEHVVPVGGLARALAGPRLDRVRRGVEQLVEPLLLVGRELRQDVVDGAAVRVTDPDPEPAELLGPELRR